MRSLFLRVPAAAAAVALVLVASGCGGSDDAAAPVTSAATPTPTPTPSPTPSPSPAPAPYTLTQAQVDAAVLTTADFPAFVDDPDALLDTPDDGTTYDPATCGEVIDRLEVVAADQTPTAVAHIGLSSGGPVFLGQDISSYAAPFSETWVEDFAAMIASCPTFAVSFPDGSRASGTLSALTIPAYGDRSTAVRAVIAADGFAMIQDLVLVTIGQVQVALGVGGVEAADPATLDQIVTTALAKLPPPA